MATYNFETPEIDTRWTGDDLPFTADAITRVRVFHAATLEEYTLRPYGKYYNLGSAELDIVIDGKDCGMLQFDQDDPPAPDVQCDMDGSLPPLLFEVTYKWDGTL